MLDRNLENHPKISNRLISLLKDSGFIEDNPDAQ